MARTESTTRSRIVSAASKLFYAEGIRRMSMDAVAEKAGVTKRTLYYHFTSKDDLVAAYLDARDQPNLALFKRWFDETPGSVATKAQGLFDQLARAARHPKWKGCGFLRTSVELVDMPGHPAIAVGIRHKKAFERWLAETFDAEGVADGLNVARQIMVLLDGAFAVGLLHRDASYTETAGAAAFTLIQAALDARQATPGEA